jgi:biotin carboxyl carrier protein
MQYRIHVNGKPFDVVIEPLGGTPSANPAPANVAPPVPAAAPSGNEERVVSPFPGNVLQVSVAVGQAVTSGQCLVVIEAMKMQNEIVAPCNGVVKQVLVSKGATVNTDDVLVVLG